MRVIYLISLFLIGILFISACTTSRPYEQPSKVENPQPQQPAQEPEKPKIQTFKIGESATDGRLKVTVKGISFSNEITKTTTTNIAGEDYSSSFGFKPTAGYQFLIIDLTIENLQSNQTAIISSLFSFKVSDADGYAYQMSFGGLSAIEKAWRDGDLLPGTKNRGNVVFEVPTNPNKLKFSYLFDIAGQTAVFELQ